MGRMLAGRRRCRRARSTLARQAQAEDRRRAGPVLLALELMPDAARSRGHRHRLPDASPRPTPALRLRLCAARWSTAQRYADAIAQLEPVTRSSPTLAAPWLTLGALQLELRQHAGRRASLQRYVQLVQAQRGGRRAPRGPTTTMTTTTTAPRRPGPDAGLAAAGAGGRAARRLRRRRSAGWRASTTRSARSRCRPGAPRCWRARASVPQARELMRSAPERNAERRARQAAGRGAGAARGQAVARGLRRCWTRPTSAFPTTPTCSTSRR